MFPSADVDSCHPRRDMSNAEQPVVRADGDLDIDRARVPLLVNGADTTSLTTSGKRARSRSRSLSARTTAKLLRQSVVRNPTNYDPSHRKLMIRIQPEHKSNVPADKQYLGNVIHYADDPVILCYEQHDTREFGDRGVTDVSTACATNDSGAHKSNLSDPLLGRPSTEGDRVLKDLSRTTYSTASRPTMDYGLEQLRLLSQEANELGLRQQRNMVAAERLQDRLVKNERTYGELLRESLEIQSSITERRKQIKTDKEELERERTAAKAISDRLCTVLATMKDLSQVISPPAAKQEEDSAD